MIHSQIKNHISETEASLIYGVGIRQFRNMRMRGTGPAWVKVSGQVGKRGGRVLYPVASLEAWLQSRPGGGEGAAA